jgi:hypothetical protein
MTVRDSSWNLDNLFGMVTGVCAEWFGVRFQAGAKDFSLLRNLQTGSETHPASYSIGWGSSFPVIKRSGRECDHSPQSSIEINDSWGYTFTPRIRLHDVDTDNSTFNIWLLTDISYEHSSLFCWLYLCEIVCTKINFWSISWRKKKNCDATSNPRMSLLFHTVH